LGGRWRCLVVLQGIVGALAGNVSLLLAVVAGGGLLGLRAVLGDVADTAASVALWRVGALPAQMAKVAACEALLVVAVAKRAIAGSTVLAAEGLVLFLFIYI